MAKFGEVAAPVSTVPPAKPAFTTDLHHFMENYEIDRPFEMFKDGYVRVILGPREHWQALRDGWTEDREFGAEYKPLSSHPDNIVKAQKQAEALRAKQEADRMAEAGNGMVKMADVQAMIQAALLAQPINQPIESD